ncbi:hypothetical protein [Meiothermus ruber]|uniref:hypothetical protein n=1 Tax=Meiothermus ruber TaxID=277 RepID=UPI000560648E|nr:hypothetical protein [Meiothermus ruber]
MNSDFVITLHETQRGWIARVEGMEDYESDPHPTPHEALEDVAGMFRLFWEAFRVLAEPVVVDREVP